MSNRPPKKFRPKSKRKPPADRPTSQARRGEGLRDNANGTRLNKVLADAGVGSRRACDDIIDAGRVKVNDVVITKNPVWVDPAIDKITVDGQPIARRRPNADLFYAMVYKPRGMICTSDDPQGRPKITDMVPVRQRLFCVGRLDCDSTGLVLLTNDGQLCDRLTHPRYEIPKTYRVTIKGELTEEDIEKLQEGLYFADKKGKTFRTSAESIKILHRERERTRLEIVLTEGRNREIRRMLAALGYQVKRLNRIAIGPLNLKGLRANHWRPLDEDEIRQLKKAAGL